MTLAILGLVVQSLTLFAIALGAWQLVSHSRQMHRDFEAIYVERYWRIMDRRSESWALKKRFTHQDRVIARQYLMLCEDEIDLRGLGRVSDATWAFWAGAIREQVAQEPYVSELNSDDYPRLCEFLTKSKDPLRHGKVWRKRHGL